MSDGSLPAATSTPADGEHDELPVVNDSRHTTSNLPSSDVYRPGKLTPDKAAHLVVGGMILGAAPILMILGVTVLGAPAMLVGTLYTVVGCANLYCGFFPVPDSQR